jgi:hypothetical protein
VQKFKNAVRYTAKIPLGQRGKLKGKDWEVLGFQVRGIVADGVQYTFDEYVLYNPYHGFRYLSEYRGHWTFIEPMPYLARYEGGMAPGAADSQRKYKLFQLSHPKTLFVIGEFPWRVRVGDVVTAKDYTNAPFSLSEEITKQEVTWSRGEYIPGKELWQAFRLPGSPPKAQGVYFNQPNPHRASAVMWKTTFLFTLILMVLMVATMIFSRNEKVYENSFYFSPSSAEPSFVTPAFELKGKNDNVQVEVKTDLANDWAYFDFALVNEETGTAYNFGREVSYYSGVDSDGSWTEGSRAESVRVRNIPGGKYFLRVEPEMEKNVSPIFASSKRVNYTLSVVRGKAVIWPYIVALPLLWLLPMIALIRYGSFETERWAEADPSGASAS